MDLLNFMRHMTCHYLWVQEGDAQRAATSAAVSQSIRREIWGHFSQKLPQQALMPLLPQTGALELQEVQCDFVHRKGLL